MLEQVLRHLNNWFLVEIHEGTFAVENGSIALPFLLNNQYFRICGSVFNDGLHQYPAADLRANFQGNPKAEVDKLLQSGAMSQQELNQLQSMAKQFEHLFH